jgi:hypothetical protein
MTKPEGRHFSAVWYALIIGAVLSTLPIDVLGLWLPWTGIARALAMLAFGMFLGAEFSAPDVQEGEAGTMTNWIYSRVHETFWRISIGVWLSLLIAWRINPWLGLVFLAWLPIHYWRAGVAGPMDRLLRWIARRFGITVRTY